MTSKIEFIESSGNLFEDIGFEKQEAKKLQFKSYLMVALMKYIQACNLTQVEAAKRLNVTQSRISNLKHFRIDLFSTEMLLDMMQRAGFRIYETLQVNIDEFLAQSWPKIPAKNRKNTRSN